jgi:hypothetical protein
MIIALILILLVAAGGFALTYLLSDEETFMWRLSAGCVIGSAIYGTLGFRDRLGDGTDCTFVRLITCYHALTALAFDGPAAQCHLSP